MKRKSDTVKRWTALLAGVCLAALAVLAALWRHEHPATGVPGQLAALLSAALFGALGVRFLYVWLGDWTGRWGQEPGKALPEPVRPAVLLRIFLAGLAWAGLTLALVYAMKVLRGDGTSFRSAMGLWELLDTQHYIHIARDGYLAEGDPGRVVELVFLPGYPLVLRLFHLLTGDYLFAGLLASALCFAGAGVLLYCLARLDMGHEAALRTLKYTCLVPGAVFFAAPMSESLFLLLSVACLYAARRKRWLAAGLMGGLAAFTRSLGLTLLAPVCYERIAEALARRDTRSAARRIASFGALLLIPAGFGAYCLICRQVTGNAFRFLTYQREHWGQSLGLFFHTAAYQTENAISYAREGQIEKVIGLWLPNLLCVFGALIVMIPAVKRLRPSYTAYFIAYYVLAVGTTWLLSGPRYLAALFPVGMALGGLTEDRRADDGLTVLLSMLYVIYAYALAARWQVW